VAHHQLRRAAHRADRQVLDHVTHLPWAHTLTKFSWVLSAKLKTLYINTLFLFRALIYIIQKTHDTFE